MRMIFSQKDSSFYHAVSELVQSVQTSLTARKKTPDEACIKTLPTVKLGCKHKQRLHLKNVFFSSNSLSHL